MKQLKLLLSGIVAFCYLQTSVRAQFSQPLSPEGIFDTIYDKDGTKYLLSDFEIAKYYSGLYAGKSVAATCNSGYFNLYFQTGSLGSGSTAQQNANQTVICKVFEDISNFIKAPGTPTVNILIAYDNTISGGILGYATQFYTMPAGTATTVGGIVDGQVYRTITSGKDAYINCAPLLYNVGVNATTPNGGYFHGMAAFNFDSYPWYTTLGSLSVPAGQFDLYSIALHEVTHALGFASLINGNGLSKMTVFGFNNYYSRFDLFLKDYNNTFLLKQVTGACGPNYNYVFNAPATSTAVLTSTVGCSQSVVYNGITNQKVFTPSTYAIGSSLSHFDDLCHTPTYTATGNVMNPSNSGGYTRRFFQPEERKVLCDLGYSVTATFGSTVAANTTTYSGGSCGGLGIAGVNDGFNAGGYIWTAPENGTVTIPTSSVVANDYNLLLATQPTSVSCPELIYGQGT